MKRLEWRDYDIGTSAAILPFGLVVRIDLEEQTYRASIGSAQGVIAEGFERLSDIKNFVQGYVDAEFKRWE